MFWANDGNGYNLYEINHPDNPLSNNSYKMVTPFGDGVAAVGDGISPIKLVNTKGKIIVELPSWISEVGAFSNGLAPFLDNRSSSYGYIDTNGDIAIEAKYPYAYTFEDGYAIVSHPEDLSMTQIDTSGNYTGVDYVTKFDIVPFVVHDKGDKVGIRELKTDKVIIPAIYDDVLIASDDRIIVYVNGESGVVDRKDKTVVPMTKNADIYSLAYGNFLYSAPESQSDVYTDGDTSVVPNNVTWVLNHNGKKKGKTYGERIFVLTKYDAKVLYSDPDQKIMPILDQLKTDMAFGFRSGTTVPEVASKLDWEIGNDNLANFRDSSYRMNHYMELPNGEYCHLILQFDGKLYRPVTHMEQHGDGWLGYEEEVIDGYEFNPDSKLTNIYIYLYSD